VPRGPLSVSAHLVARGVKAIVFPLIRLMKLGRHLPELELESIDGMAHCNQECAGIDVLNHLEHAIRLQPNVRLSKHFAVNLYSAGQRFRAPSVTPSPSSPSPSWKCQDFL